MALIERRDGRCRGMQDQHALARRVVQPRPGDLDLLQLAQNLVPEVLDGALVAGLGRGDAAFAKPEIYESSEERGVQYAIRIPANKSLELEIEDILFRSPGKTLPEALGALQEFSLSGRER